MNQHLFVDALRRIRTGLLAVGALAAVLWVLTGTGASGAAFGITLSMSLAVIAGPFAGASIVAPREVLLLPLSRQEVWRTRWCIGTAVTAGVMTTGKIAGMLLGRQSLPIEVVWLSSLLDLACIGIVTSLLPAVQALQSIRVTGSGPWKRAVAAAPVIGSMIFPFSPFLPFLAFKYVPTSWSHLPALALAFMIIGAGLAAASYFMTPRAIPGPSRGATRAALQTRGKSRWPVFPNVTGLRRLIGQAWLRAALIQAGTILTVPTLMSLLDRASGGRLDWLGTARDFGFLPFEAGHWSANWIMIFVFGSIASGQTLATLRQLRTLPVSAFQLNGVFAGLSLTAWVNAWVFLAAFHVVATGRPIESWQVPMFLAFFSLEYLARAINVHWQHQFGGLFLVGLVIGPAGVLATKWNLSTDVLLLTVCLVALPSAFLLNHLTMTRSRKAYAAKNQTFLENELPT